MDEVSGVRGSLETQYVSPVFGKLPHPAGQTLPTQADHSLQSNRLNIINKHFLPHIVRHVINLSPILNILYDYPLLRTVLRTQPP